MLSPKILYSKFAAFLGKDLGRPIFTLLYFSGEEVVASDSYWMAVAKNYKTPEHFEERDGRQVDFLKDHSKVTGYPDWKRLIPKEKDCRFYYDYNDNSLKGNVLRQINSIIKPLSKAIKVGKDKVPCGCLAKKGTSLYYLAADGRFTVKVKLIDGIKGQPDFCFYCSPERLAKATDLLAAEGTRGVNIRITQRENLMYLETENLIILGTGLVRNKSDEFMALADYVEEEFPPEPKDTDEDLDFLK